MSSSKDKEAIGEVLSALPTPRPPPVSTPPSRMHSPRTPGRSPLRVMATRPIKKAVVSVRDCLEEVGNGNITRLADPRDAWLPITESRSGNAYYAAFHNLSSGIGFQALLLPIAFAFLGWSWAIFFLTLAFVWQLYTLWLLVKLHEPVAGGIRYSRYMHLAATVFGERWAKILTLLPVMYLSAGTCTALIIVGGGSMKTLFSVACGEACLAHPLTTVEWYLVFICAATLLSQLPNLNSIAGVSLVGATAAVAYCTVFWVVSVAKGSVPDVSYDPVKAASGGDAALAILNGLPVIAFAFRGHNLVLEIQGTMPSTPKHPSHVPMWKGVKLGSLCHRRALLVPHRHWRLLGLWQPDSSQRHAERSVQVPRPRRVPDRAGHRHAAGHHQLPHLVPDLRHARVRQHGGRVRAQEGPPVPVVAALGIPRLLRRRQLPHRRRASVPIGTRSRASSAGSRCRSR